MKEKGKRANDFAQFSDHHFIFLFWWNDEVRLLSAHGSYLHLIYYFTGSVCMYVLKH